MEDYLSATAIIDSDHPDVVDYAARVVGSETDQTRTAIRLYEAVRDDIRYDPYRLDLTTGGMRASTTLANGYGWCVAKAALLAAVARAVGIPARLAFADVRNHLTTERLTEQLGTDVFVYHGTTQLLLHGRWVRCTPAFNAELCAYFGVEPLAFDGVHDSLLQPSTSDGSQFMEYLTDRGTAADVPLDDIIQAFREAYPHAAGAWLEVGGVGGDFGAEAAAEGAHAS